MIWFILAVLAFLAGQVYLFHLLRKLDQFLARREIRKTEFTYDDSCRYWNEESEDVK